LEVKLLTNSSIYNRRGIQGLTKPIALAILLVVILLLVIPVSYFMALKIMGDANSIVGFSSSNDSIRLTAENATLSTFFLLENRGNIAVTYNANITVFVLPVENRPFSGNLEFYFSPHLENFEDWIYLGNVSAKNALAPPHGYAEVPACFDIVSEDALDVMRSGNFTAFWVAGTEVTGSFFGWRITQRPIVM
jgi:hypothetical protein